MRIRSSELNLEYSRFTQTRVQTANGEINSKHREQGNRGDRVSISSAGLSQSKSSSTKVNAVFSESLVHEKNGAKSKLNFGSLNFSRQDKGRRSSWHLGVSNIRTSDQSRIPGQTRISVSAKTHSEKEQMAFKGSGNISMADGRQVEFSLEMLMKRDYEMQQSEALTNSSVQLMDPLVINFSNNSPTLTDAKYQFDLDADGLYENISFVGPGSGFLTIDLNEDGVVNDGRELFGPNTGSGFNDLRSYDLDGNNWIDENDTIVEQLKVWSKDGSGQDRFMSLKELGIGAVSLENIATPFSITNHQNELQGQVSNSSVTINEDGSVGTVQQIDLMAEQTMNLVEAPEPTPVAKSFIVDIASPGQSTVDQLQESVIQAYQQQKIQHMEVMEEIADSTAKPNNMGHEEQ